MQNKVSKSRHKKKLYFLSCFNYKCIGEICPQARAISIIKQQTLKMNWKKKCTHPMTDKNVKSIQFQVVTK